MALEPLEVDPIDERSELISPFEEDRLDEPAFLRRGGRAVEEDENEPAFLRRSMD
jgi:hypothetical protein